ncbi:MAG: substrate-binding domain-containing protein [Lentisphaerae bacterium]|nr:substrate-binding domain-containing protein [Lentisphaerota bacterium]
MSRTTKGDQIIEYFMGQLRHGDLKRGQKIQSEYELAEMFSVNKTTANKAVARLVDRGFLKRCRGGAGTIVAKTTDYPIGTIAFVIALQNISFQPHLLRGGQRAAFVRHYRTEYIHPSPREEEDHFWQMVCDSGIDGLITFGNFPPPDLPFPVMFVDTLPRSEDRAKRNWVISDNRHGGYLIGRHLCEMGHTNPVFAPATHLKDTLAGQRAMGFIDALREAGIENPEDHLFPVQVDDTHIAACMDRACKVSPEITAIAFDRDQNAMLAIAALKERGLSIPRDMSVTGYGRLDEFSESRLTSIDQHPQELSFRAMDLLIDLIEGKATAPIQEMLPVELYSGDTVAALARSRRA